MLRQTVTSLIVVLIFCLPSYAFHDKGVAGCRGCHIMHNSEDGIPVDPDSPSGNEWLLIAETPSDVCLSCHATELGAVFGQDPLSPPATKGAGNFVFLMENNLNDAVDGAINPINGDAAGHNINAPSMGISADGTRLVSPGGTFPSDQLGCTSCHDPHGNQNFRFLYGIGPVASGGATFTNPAPVATGISVEAEFGPESNEHHTAYQSGMSAWCGNCHGDFHSAGAPFVHPTDGYMHQSVIQRYNFYNGTDDPNGGVAATAYLALVPFEDVAGTVSSTAGPSSAGGIMCLTCHRAHGSSAPNATRWDMNVVFMSDDGVVSGSYPIPDPFSSPTQRSLCSKCHTQHPERPQTCVSCHVNQPTSTIPSTTN